MIINEQKYKNADDVFAEGNYNHALYKYALEKVCDQERTAKEKIEINLCEKNQKVSIFERIKNLNLYLFVSLGIILFTVILIGANYFNTLRGLKVLNR